MVFNNVILVVFIKIKNILTIRASNRVAYSINKSCTEAYLYKGTSAHYSIVCNVLLHGKEKKNERQKEGGRQGMKNILDVYRREKG